MKRVLIVLPFENIYPPMNGGMLRGMNLLNQFSKHFDVTAIIRQEAGLFSKAIDDYPSLKKATILSVRTQDRKRDLFDLLPSRFSQPLRYRYWKRSLNGPASTSFLIIYPVLKRLLAESRYDYIILGDLSIIDLARVIRRFQPNACIIYDAYNVNTRLAEAALASGATSRREVEVIRKSESSLFKMVDKVFTCSEQDLKQLKRMNGDKLEGTMIPNGVAVMNDVPDEDPGEERSGILFCGSLDYFPNQEGLIWFCDQVLPILVEKEPSVRLKVVGKGNPGEELHERLKNEAVIYYGMVEDVRVYYKQAALAIVPLLSGSGTRLKLLEAMGNGVAVVSTTVGAEGIDYAAGHDIIIADNNMDFANETLKLLKNQSLAKRIALNAHAFVKDKYDWDLVGDRIFEYLN